MGEKKYLHNFIFINIILLLLSVAFYNNVCTCYAHEQCFVWCLDSLLYITKLSDGHFHAIDCKKKLM